MGKYITPQIVEAFLRGLKVAVGAVMGADGMALVTGQRDVWVLLGIGLGAAAGTMGVRVGYEGVVDSRRARLHQMIASDVKEKGVSNG